MRREKIILSNVTRGRCNSSSTGQAVLATNTFPRKLKLDASSHLHLLTESDSISLLAKYSGLFSFAFAFQKLILHDY